MRGPSVTDQQTELASLLRDVPMFTGLSDKTLKGIARQMKEYSRAAGDTVVEQGREGDLGHMYVVLEGTLSVDASGNELAELGPGDHFGEMALLDGKPRSATVTATSFVRLAGLSAWNFRALLHEETEIVDRVIAVLIERLRVADASL